MSTAGLPLAFYDVDTLDVTSGPAPSLILKARVLPIAQPLARLRALARAHGLLLVSSCCVHVNVNTVHGLLPEGTVLVPWARDEHADWGARLAGARSLLLGRHAFESRDENMWQRVFQLFHNNENAAAVFDAPGPRRWIVFGDSVRMCLQTGVRALLSRGDEVTVVTDAVHRGPDDESVRIEVLATLRSLGVHATTTDELVATLGPAPPVIP